MVTVDGISDHLFVVVVEMVRQSGDVILMIWIWRMTLNDRGELWIAIERRSHHACDQGSHVDFSRSLSQDELMMDDYNINGNNLNFILTESSYLMRVGDP